VSFINQLKKANNLLHERRLNLATSEYRIAVVQANNNNERMQAWQMMGIALRLAKEYSDSVWAFNQSIKMADSDITVARIQRDKAMTFIDWAASDKSQKQHLIQSAKSILVSSRDTLKSVGYLVEAAASESFLARAYLVEGDRTLAKQTFAKADYVLCDFSDADYNPQYELNNLVWMARSSFIVKITNAHRAYKLAMTLSQEKRWEEYLVILIGGNILYRYVNARKKS
jgi:hypothetical protein